MKATASCLLTAVSRTITFQIAFALSLTWVAFPLAAQNPVPLTASQAAKLPQYAPRLSHAAGPNAAPARQRSRKQSTDNPIYENGPINGGVDAFTINFGFVVSNTFTVSSSGSGSITGMSFGAWLFPGDILESAEISITSSEYGGTTYFDQTVGLSSTSCTTNPFGFSVCTETSTFNPPALQPGTYWVNVQNAYVNTGDPAYWDENSGSGCTSPGCPSLASENSVGTIPSESFTMEGSGPPPPPPSCYRSEGALRILHSFLEPQLGPQVLPTGVAMDDAGNLYGTTIAGGRHYAGFAYKMAHFADWLFEPLFNFFGGDDGGAPSSAIIGPNGSLYGGAQGGIQNCGSDGSHYCGLVYNLMPTPNPCASARCGWNESVPYRFTSESDGSGVINVSAHDQQGNLYGTTSSGGAYGSGTVFELTPSGGGWAKTTLYSFTGGDDGTSPTQVLFGNDGNLYGVASSFLHPGVVFQLTPSGGVWIESVIHSFESGGSAGLPTNLVQDSAGTLYGTLSAQVLFSFAPIFALSKTGSQWSYSEYAPEHYCQGGDVFTSQLNNLTIDAAGNLYGTGTGSQNVSRNGGTKSPGQYSCFYNFIYKARYDNSGGWHYDDLWYSDNEYFQSQGSLAVDASGNLYGTTTDCGIDFFGGTVWQLSP